MCGIFGLSITENSEFSKDEAEAILKKLFILSESRGKEASGLALMDASKISILKSSLTASKLINSTDYKDLLNTSLKEKESFFTAIGHSRLVTNGRSSLNNNNQPIAIDNLVCVHNGIVTNDSTIWKKIDQSPKTDLDTEALVALVNEYTNRNNLSTSVKNAFLRLEGSASCAFLNYDDKSLVLASNNGSIYYFIDKNKGIMLFASEHAALSKTIVTHLGKSSLKTNSIKQVAHDTSIQLKPDDLAINLTSWNKQDKAQEIPTKSQRNSFSLVKDFSKRDFPDLDMIQRCTRCILPETFPYISFDLRGVCNYCNNYTPQEERNHERIKEIVQPYRSLTNEYNQNCIVGLSGGRDSCYGVHYAKKVLGLNPVAFTYDWGMVTDLARRNIFRMCGELGVEHILVSANIKKKRDNVRKNIAAWLKKPELFMIPLFMAGDKQFYLHAHKLRKQLDIKLFMFGAGNTLETTDFKVGFANIENNSSEGVLTQLHNRDKIKLIAKYGLEFLKNPSYINSSLLDSLEGFYSSYLLRDDYTYLYHHIPWIEEEVESVLKDQYGWEGAKDTKTSWRVGDGTAAFYNYIYFSVAGFSEHDTFRSNQIREGMITREKALELVKAENQPRWDTLNWYASTIGFNLDDALSVINKIPRLYS